MRSALLSVRSARKTFGGLLALDDVSLNILPGQIYGLIGPNGAGKTTTLKAIAGLIPVAEGSVFFHGEEITKTPAYRRPTKGLVMVPEGRGVFTRMSVIENLQMGAYCQSHSSQSSADIKALIEVQLALFPRLKERYKQLAGTLSGGEQQMLAVARALMARPRVLVLDEPSMGLSPVMVEKIFSVIRDVSQSGVTILLIEQNARLALEAADRGYVMESGLITSSARAQDLLADPAVRIAYLGESP